jgi:hypothetical protein
MGSFNRLIVLVVLIFLTNHSFAQTNYDSQFDLANNLMNEEKYFEAITEFKRLIFFEKDSENIYLNYSLIGDCYKAGAKFDESIYYYTLSEINSKTSGQIYASQIKIIRSNILRRTTNRALSLLDSLAANKNYSDKIDEINYWRGWTFIFSDEWENAAGEFSKVDSAKQLEEFCRLTDDKLYSVPLVKAMSFILPGLGQFYTGNYVSGVISLGWNVLWGYTAIKAFAVDRIFDGAMVSNFLWFRFYRGNFENAEKFAEADNLIETNNALKWLQNEFTGTKP